MSYFGSTEWLIEVRRGNIEGHSITGVTGRNPDIDMASGFEDIWDGGGLYTGMPIAPFETLEILSDNANDTLAGTGARAVIVQGLLDENFNEVPDVVVNMNGVTPVSLGVGLYSRIRLARVVAVGSGGVNEGTITIRHTTTTTNVFTQMQPLYSTSFVSAYTVPAGKVAILLDYWSSLSKKKDIFSRVRALSRLNGQGWVVEEEIEVSSSGNSYVSRVFPGGSIPLPEKTDLKLEADSDTNDSGISGGGTLLVINADLLS